MYYRRIGCRIRGITATSEQKRVARERGKRVLYTNALPDFFFFKKECFHLKKENNKNKNNNNL